MIQDDINSLVKQEKINKTLPELPENDGYSSKRAGGKSDEIDDGVIIMEPPLTFKILTYDPANNVALKDSAGNPVTDAEDNPVIIIQAKTAVVIDANDNEYLIDTILLNNAVPG